MRALASRTSGRTLAVAAVVLGVAHCSSNPPAASGPDAALDASTASPPVDAMATADVAEVPDTSLSLDAAAVADVADAPEASPSVDAGGDAEADAPLPASCTDGILNGSETDIDCGGSCDACGPGLKCGKSGDCRSHVCVASDGGAESTCQATCTDGERDGTESDVDCGGSCGACSAGALCNAPGDCKSGSCTSADGGPKTCQATCSDGERNASETDVDCGGTCNACDIGQECAVGGDCANLSCVAHVCQAATCNDGVKNQGESAIDCGGTACKKCVDGKTCNGPTDCKNGRCDKGLCVSCSDGIKNADESDVDCGGTTCGGCDEGQSCNGDNDCLSLSCTTGKCDVTFKGGGTVADPYRTANPLASCAAYLATFPTLAVNGVYQVKPGGSVVLVTCEQSVSGGGWMQLTQAAVDSLTAGPTREYLYLANGKWYRSPSTTLVWSWTASAELAGTYAYFDGTTPKTLSCGGSGEKPAFGVGCSAGGGPQTKVLPAYAYDAAKGTATICQDVPNAFGSPAACATGVAVFAR